MKNHRSKSSEPSTRQRRVGEQLRHVICEALTRGHFDSELLFNESDTISVSEVIPSPDLKQAKAYIVSFNGKDLQDLVKELNEQAYVFQKEFSHRTNLKFTPKIRFEIDTSFDKAEHIETLLKDVNDK